MADPENKLAGLPNVHIGLHCEPQRYGSLFNVAVSMGEERHKQFKRAVQHTSLSHKADTVKQLLVKDNIAHSVKLVANGSYKSSHPFVTHLLARFSLEVPVLCSRFMQIEKAAGVDDSIHGGDPGARLNPSSSLKRKDTSVSFNLDTDLDLRERLFSAYRKLGIHVITVHGKLKCFGAVSYSIDNERQSVQIHQYAYLKSPSVLPVYVCGLLSHKMHGQTTLFVEYKDMQQVGWAQKVNCAVLERSGRSTYVIQSSLTVAADISLQT